MLRAVWWLGARLTEERERACDEEVVRMGGEPQVYAESILKVCEFYLASPAPCAAGVTGGELKKRIEGIMANRFTRKLNFGKKLLLAAVAAAAVSGPFLLGVANGGAQTKTPAPLPKFEVASVKRTAFTGQTAAERNRGWGDATGKVNLRSIPLKFVLMRVYNIQDYQLSGPDWLGSDAFDILANAPAGAPKEQIPLMFQDLLAERFKMKFHRETQTASCYALVVGDGGPKMKPGMPDEGAEIPLSAKTTGSGENRSISGKLRGPYGVIRITAWNGVLRDEFEGVTMDGLAKILSTGVVDLPVVDMTGLKGSYQVTMDIPSSELLRTPNQTPPDQADTGQSAPTASDPPGASVRSSLEKQGLRLVRRRLPIEKFVIDHIERTPTEN
jgi:uncharacterized protein (TIGR03435 family)